MKQALDIPAAEYERRLASLQKAMQERGLDGLLVFGSFPEQEGNISYLSNFRQGYPKNLRYGGAGCHALLFSQSGPGILVSPQGQIDSTVVNIQGVKAGYDLGQELAAVVREKHLANDTLGLVGTDLLPSAIWQATEKALSKAAFEPADDILADLRSIKSPEEIALLSKATSVGNSILAAGMEAARQGSTEAQVELAMRQAAFEAGADLLARVGVNSGPSLKPRGWPFVSGRVLQAGDFVMLEIAGWANGYAFCGAKAGVVGAASAAQEDHLKHLEEAAAWMVETLQPHQELGYVMTMHREQRILPSAHGIGLEIFEHPWVVMGPMPTKPFMQPKTVMCVEPVMVDARFGTMSICQTVLLTESGPRVLPY